MLVCDVTTPDLRLLAPYDVIQSDARRMRDDNVGLLPVADDDPLVGLVVLGNLVTEAASAASEDPLEWVSEPAR